ncbi:MAG: RagB/SusD family nutrient uptake outer membrane protein [Rikenellaceae bacterium]|jgi:hypothetical protein|nr:RagB/SusD family nutrient uptake outer membrane protein [Rikenellaceae bacterium]
MKKILLMTIAAGLLFGNSGCEKSFDLLPSTSLPAEEAIQSEADLQLALNGAYEMITVDYGGYSSDYTLYADCTGGDVASPNDNGQITPFIKFEINETHKSTNDIYFALYEPIAFANMALAAAVNLEQTAEVVRLTGELKGLRAILHLSAASAYAQIPTVSGANLDAADSGIVIANEVYAPNEKFARTTLNETYTFITEELKEAMSLLNTAEGKAKLVGGVNYWAAEAALARAYLYWGKNSEAYAAATDVIANGGYTLLTYDNYIASWKTEGASEVIFEVTNGDNYNVQRNSLGYYTNPDGYAEVGASPAMLAANAALSDNDIRKSAITERATATGAYKGYYTIKYMGKNGATNALYNNNPRVFRLAEMYLIAAEAAVKSGSATDAAKYYNDLRRSRYAADTYTDAAGVTIDQILEDRRVELFCEGHRMFDLKRNNKPVVTSNNTLQPNDNKLVLPIPLRELDISAPLLVQNPGY